MRNAPSPAATSSLALARLIAERVESGDGAQWATKFHIGWVKTASKSASE